MDTLYDNHIPFCMVVRRHMEDALINAGLEVQTVLDMDYYTLQNEYYLLTDERY